MSEQGWLKREIETVRREVAAWPAWKRGEGMDDVKRYKLSQDVRYNDGAFVIPAGQVVVREADYDTLREQNRVLRSNLVNCAARLEAYYGEDYPAVRDAKAALTATSQPAKPAGKMHACDIPGCVSCGNPEDATSQEVL